MAQTDPESAGETAVPQRGPRWRTGDVWAISMSTFFTDLGYQDDAPLKIDSVGPCTPGESSLGRRLLISWSMTPLQASPEET
ncbi:MAG: hypothetical protein ACYCYA_00790 [Actinomycetes bacterium]